MKDETVSGQNSAVVFLYLYATVNAVGLYWCVCVCVGVSFVQNSL